MPTKRINIQIKTDDQQLLIEVQARVQKRLQKDVSIAEVFRMALRALEATEADLA